MKIRTIIADDEPHARGLLREYLSSDSDIEIIAECGDGTSTIEQVRRLRPDLLFLDIEMPEADGLEVVEQMGSDSMPVVVFVTAFDEHAVKAFELHAAEYLVKPFNFARFSTALQHAKALSVSRDPAATLLAIRHAMHSRHGAGYADRFGVRENGRIAIVKTDDIDWIEADGNYVKLHIGNRVHVLRETMRDVEMRLDPRHFARIHRSTIVNVLHIRELESWVTGEYIVHMNDGRELTMTRTYRDRVMAILGIGRTD